MQEVGSSNLPAPTIVLNKNGILTKIYLLSIIRIDEGDTDKGEEIKPIQRNGITVRIRRTLKHGSERFIIDYRNQGQRKLLWRSSLVDARKAANDAIDKITEGQGDVLNLKSADAHAVIRARARLEGGDGEIKIDLQIDEAVRECAEMRRMLARRAMPIEVCRDWLSRHAVELPKITVTTAVEELKRLEKADGQSNDRMKQFSAHLTPLAIAFNQEVQTLTPKLIADYLGAMTHGERTKANHRDTIGYFNRWPILRGYLPKGTDWLEGVKEYAKQKVGEIEVLSSEDMRRLIKAADKRILPMVVIGRFSGLRHEEIRRLDWRDIDISEGFIEVKASKSKTGTRRSVPMKGNLKAFLKPLAKKSGKVVSLVNTTKQLLKTATDIADEANDIEALVWKRNALRHTYISARLAECGDEARVAYEAGNSPQVIRSNYDARIRPKAAAKWFAIKPPVVVK